MHDRKKDRTIALLGIATALMLLVGCEEQGIQKRTERDIASQVQQNVEEEALLEELEQPEQTEEISDDKVQDKLNEERIIEEQSFQVELNDWGEVRLVSYEPDPSERDPDEDVTFYLLKDDEILYQFPYIGEDHRSGYGLYWDVKFVMFMDTNADGKEDIVIGPEYMTGAGPQGAIPHLDLIHI